MAIIFMEEKGPIVLNPDGFNKLVVPDRRSYAKLKEELVDPQGHSVTIERVVHDTKPDDKRSGVAFVDVRHAPNCRLCEKEAKKKLEPLIAKVCNEELKSTMRFELYEYCDIDKLDILESIFEEIISAEDAAKGPYSPGKVPFEVLKEDDQLRTDFGWPHREVKIVYYGDGVYESFDVDYDDPENIFDYKVTAQKFTIRTVTRYYDDAPAYSMGYSSDGDVDTCAVEEIERDFIGDRRIVKVPVEEMPKHLWQWLLELYMHKIRHKFSSKKF